ILLHFGSLTHLLNFAKATGPEID
ncbi:MAG: hypothetical protein RIR86_389, partial [Acidobacteriota bacterium]